MLAGAPPFFDDDPLATYRKILAGAPHFPPHFPPAARDLVKKLLQVSGRRLGTLGRCTLQLGAWCWHCRAVLAGEAVGAAAGPAGWG